MIQSEGSTEDNQSCSQNREHFPLAYCSYVISHLIFQCLICKEGMTGLSNNCELMLCVFALLNEKLIKDLTDEMLINIIIIQILFKKLHKFTAINHRE